MEIGVQMDKIELLESLWVQESRQGSRKPFGMDAERFRTKGDNEEIRDRSHNPSR